jgi:hypothetical protein
VALTTRAARGLAGALAGFLAVVGCDGARTEILVEVGSDLSVPGELDRVTIAAQSPDGRVQESIAELGAGRLPLPRTLGMVHEDGPLGPFTMTVRGELAGAEVVRREGILTFQRARTLVWRVQLLRECETVTCGADTTCAAGGCRGVEVLPGELVELNGPSPPLDAGPFDACVPEEPCNGADDDCDGIIDEGIDFMTDEESCGGCGISCDRDHASTSCVGGMCVIDSCDEGFGNCDKVDDNGCETDTTLSGAHCGMCGSPCTPPNTTCCAGTCARTC